MVTVVVGCDFEAADDDEDLSRDICNRSAKRLDIFCIGVVFCDLVFCDIFGLSLASLQEEFVLSLP